MKSGNIIGEGFDDYVEKQINIRQKKLSELDKTNESILVFNSSAPWIRLASSVNLTDEDSKVKEILGSNFSNYKGSELAKNFVLFGGVSTYSGNHTSGVARSNNSLNLNKSYGFGGLNNGLVPLPGIESVNITSYNRGSLRKAEIKLRAYNTLQFYIIDILYMRVGYTALLEWGHSLYFNNNENYEKNNTFVTTPYTNLFSKNSLNPTTPNLNNIPQSKPTAASQLEIAIARQKILNPNNVTQYSIIEDIEKERELRSGNYDGFFGKITSFNWSLTPNGAYDINITMISIGDVIESLKTNISLNNEIINNETTDTKDTVEPAKNIASTLIDLGKQAIDSNNGEYKLTTIPEFNNIEKQLISITPKGKDEKPYYYIKLGILLQVIEQQLLIYNKQFGEKVPYIKIDNDFDRNIFLTVPYQFSSDYNICLIPTTVATDQNNGISLLQDKLGSQVRISENVYAGKLMHIHINMDIIPKILDQLIDEDGKVPILSFLETLMEEIQKALGNINKFTVTYDDITNTLKILDDNPIPYLKNITELNYQNKLTTFNINGVQYEKLGSFINSIDLKAEISNELATIIAVGAQASGNIVGANATAFSTWNKGLIDRIIPEKITAGEPGSNSNPYTTFINNVTLINNILLRLYKDFDWSSDEDINTLTQLYTDTLNYYMGYLAQNNQISPPGFIPFNLGLNMKGLSGMKLYQTFKVTENLLPPTYNKNLRFIIKNLDHSIDSNGWITKIQSLTTGADPSGSSYTPPQIIINSSTPAEENTGKSLAPATGNTADQSNIGSCGSPSLLNNNIFSPHKNLNTAQNIIDQIQKIQPPLVKSSGYCSRYAYNYADKFINIPSGDPGPSLKLSGKGNAKDDSTRNFLYSIGYKLDIVAKNYTKANIIKLIDSQQYKLGDIAVYHANDAPIDAYTKYGHIAMYIGNGRWLSDFKHGSFVYRNSGGTHNCWNLYILRAPII